MADATATVAHLRDRVAAFVSARDWEKYHNPKDIAISMSVEAAELLELFQWKSDEDVDLSDAPFREALEDELADVFVYCLSLANAIGCELAAVTTRKMAVNEKRWPPKDPQAGSRPRPSGSDSETTVSDIKHAHADFIRERRWKDYSRPKEIAVSISVEAAELLELFRWRSNEESDVRNPEFRGLVEGELADVVIYCISLTTAVGCDLSDVTLRKLAKNERKYPAAEWRGRATPP